MRPSSRAVWLYLGIAVVLLMAAVVFLVGNLATPKPPGTAASSPPTFNRDIAPIIHANCSVCHRPGESGPFNLLTYEDVKSRASLIVEVTSSRLMPPWLPEPGRVRFAQERRLSDQQIGAIARWVAEGSIEGDTTDLRPVPTWTDGWQLGEPDLVVEMPEAYTVPTEGSDDFRNFVLPLSLPEDRFVRAIELRPGNPKIVHHATILVDRDRRSRVTDAEDPGPGFSGMDQRAEIGSPEGHFVGWTPGKAPYLAPEGMAWRLDKDADLVLLLHLVPSGKPEVVRSKLGLFFSKTPPTRETEILRLGSKAIELPAGASNYVVEDQLVLPVDTDIFALYPHAHYLANEVGGTAVLPGGSTLELIRIKSWDFNWQDEYRYTEPLTLPKGTVVRMRFTYDNSEANPRNPDRPPERVMWGPRSRDEMANLWIHAAPHNPRDLPLLRRASAAKKFSEDLGGFRHAVATNPDSPRARTNLGVALRLSGRPDQAAEHLKRAAELDSNYVAAQFNLGVLFLDLGDRSSATRQFERTLNLDPTHVGAHVNLGGFLLEQNQLAAAARHFERALTIKPAPDVHFNLGMVRLKQGRLREAEAQFEATLAEAPDIAQARDRLAEVKRRLQQSP